MNATNATETLSLVLTGETKGYTQSLAQAEAATKKSIRTAEERVRQLRQEQIALGQSEKKDKARVQAIKTEIQTLQVATSQQRARLTLLKEEARETAKLEKETAKLNKERQELVTGLGGSIGKFTGLVSVVGALGAAFAGLNLVKKADEFKGLQARVSDALGSIERGTVVFGQLTAISSQTGAKLEDTVSVFERVSFAAREVGKSTNEALKLTQLVQQIGAINQVSEGNLSAGLLQLGQALSAGTVRAEEFNSILENIPGLAREIAAGLGTSVGQLRQMVLDGKVASSQVFDAILKRADLIEDRFNKLPPSLQRSSVALQNALGGVVLSLDKSLQITNTLAQGMQALAGILDNLKGTIDNNAGSLREFAKQAVAVGAALLGAGGLFVALSQGPALVAAVIAAVTRLGAVLTSVFTTATVQATVATGGLNLALAALAGVGIYAFVRGAQEGAEAARIFAQDTDDLRDELANVSLQSLSTTAPLAGLGKEYDDLAKKTNKTQQEQARMNDILDIARDKLPGLGGPIDGLISKYGSLEKAIRAARIEQAALLQEKAIDAQIEAAKQSALNADQSTVIVSGVPGAGAVTRPVFTSGRAKAEAKIKQLEKQRENVRKDVERQLKLIETPTKPTGGFAPVAKKKKGKKGPSAESIDAKNLQNLQTQLDLSNRLQRVDLGGRRQAVDLGPLADEFRRTQIDAQVTADKIRITQEAIQRFQKLAPRTKEGQAELNKVISGLKNDLEELGITQDELANKTKALVEAENEAIQKFFDSQAISEAENRFKEFSDLIGERQDDLKRQYDEGRITATEYYEALKKLSFEAQKIEVDASNARINALRREKETLKDTIEDRARKREIEKALEEEKARQDDIARRAGQRERQITKEALADSPAERLKESVTNGLTEAITDVLSGQSTIKGAIKKFAQTLRQAVAQELANAITQRFIKPAIGKLFDALFPNAGTPGQPGAAGGQAPGIGSIIGGIFGNIGKGKGPPIPNGRGGVLPKQTFLGKIGGRLGTATGGLALAGTGIGLGIASGGAKKGNVLASAGGGLLAGASLGFLVGGPVGAAIGAAIGLIGGGVAGLFGRRQQKSLKRVENARATALAGLDQNNLNLDDLQNRLNTFSQVRARGKKAKAAKQQTINELNDLIILRRRQIDEFISQIQEQNRDLENSITIANAKPFEQAALERKFELERLAADTQKLLNQYRDSQAAQTEILKQESLKRQEIEKKAQDQLKGTIEETQRLLEERDRVANANVFTRRESAEAAKARQISDIDKQLNTSIAEIASLTNAGVAAPQIAGANALIKAARQISQTNQFQITINQAEDPNAVGEEVRRQIVAISRGLAFVT